MTDTTLKSATDKARDVAMTAGEKVSAAASTASDKVTAAANATVEAAKEHPYAAAGIAVGVAAAVAGAVVGAQKLREAAPPPRKRAPAKKKPGPKPAAK